MTNGSSSQEAQPPLAQLGLRAEIIALAAIALPSALTSAARTLLDLENTAVIGRIPGPHGKPTALFLDAAALAAMFINVTQTSFGRSCDGALSVLVAQAFGARNRHLIGIWLVIGLFSFTLSALLLGGMWSASPFLLQLLDSTDAAAAKLASRYTLLAIPSVFPNMLMWCVAVWLIGQNIAWPEMVVYFCTVAVNVGLNWGLVFAARLGFDGAPLAVGLTRLLGFLGLATITAALHRRRAIRLPAFCAAATFREACRRHRLRSFAEQALPQLLMALLQEFGFAAVAFVASRIGEAAFSAHNIMFQCFIWLTAPLFGLISATEVRIGNHLGAGDARSARRVAWLAVYAALLLASAVAAALFALRDRLGYIFTKDEDVVINIRRIAPIAGGCCEQGTALRTPVCTLRCVIVTPIHVATTAQPARLTSVIPSHP